MTLPGVDARTEWDQRFGVRTARVEESDPHGRQLPAPEEVTVATGRGQVTVWWSPVDGAVGYLVARGPSQAGPFELVRVAEADVLAVPAPPFLDTQPSSSGATPSPSQSSEGGSAGGVDRRATPGRPGAATVEPATVRGARVGGWYRVAAVSEPGGPPGIWSVPVEGRGHWMPEGAAGEVWVEVNAARQVGERERPWRVVGLEHPGEFLLRDDGFGHDVRAELIEALRIGQRELGIEMVRAHHIFDDALGVYRETEDGKMLLDFSLVDEVCGLLQAEGLRPIVELSFMPAALATDPNATVFDYRAIISPPRDLERWAALCRELAAHLCARFGVEEVRRWRFEVWNEPNLAVFWTGSQAEYFALYDAAARAIKAVDADLKVGGPATAAAEWLEDFLCHVEETETPVDFLSTHTYGNAPVDPRPLLRRHRREDVEILWTEWGVAPTHGAPLHDSAFGAPFILRGMKSAMGRISALAYWVLSDHFEELGRPERLRANGFGLLTVGNLRKPRFHALRLLEELGPVLLDLRIEGDGAGSLVDGLAATGDGLIDLLVWNGSFDPGQWEGVDELARTVHCVVTGLPPGPTRIELARIDAHRSNLFARLSPEVRWPEGAELIELRRASDLWREERHLDVGPDGRLVLEELLPMPGVLRLRAWTTASALGEPELGPGALSTGKEPRSPGGRSR